MVLRLVPQAGAALGEGGAEGEDTCGKAETLHAKLAERRKRSPLETEQLVNSKQACQLACERTLPPCCVLVC